MNVEIRLEISAIPLTQSNTEENPGGFPTTQFEGTHKAPATTGVFFSRGFLFLSLLKIQFFSRTSEILLLWFSGAAEKAQSSSQAAENQDEHQSSLWKGFASKILP